MHNSDNMDRSRVIALRVCNSDKFPKFLQKVINFSKQKISLCLLYIICLINVLKIIL